MGPLTHDIIYNYMKHILHLNLFYNHINCAYPINQERCYIFALSISIMCILACQESIDRTYFIAGDTTPVT